jgi:hypothetical protein
MDHLCWWSDNAGAIQAICATLGVIGLTAYCILTHHIRGAAVAQQKASQAPMLMFFKSENKWGDGQAAWAIKNYGVGPAVGIWWKSGFSNVKSNDWYELGALGAGDESELPHRSRPSQPALEQMPSDGARLHYSDSAGNHYATWGFWKDGSFQQDWAALKKRDRREL